MLLDSRHPRPDGKILVVDLDDTLLLADKTVTATTRAALVRWQAAGHAIVVATGRPPRAVGPVLPPELADAIRIVYNGAHIVAAGCTIFRNEVAPETFARSCSGPTAVRRTGMWVSKSKTNCFSTGI